jgi:hypothetical protein
MKAKIFAAAVGVVTTLTGVNSALAQEAKTREQVKAEFFEAARTGDLYVGDSSLKQNEICPSCYPAKPAVVGKSRGQVRAELAAAIKSGDIIVGDQSLSLRELFPSQYPPVAIDAGKTREQVEAERGAAERNGDIVVSFAGKPEREIAPGFFEKARVPASPFYASAQTGRKTRAQVYAEPVAAKRAGESGID